jgi:hypothetical protein
MTFPLTGRTNPKLETSVGHGGTETQSGNGSFLSFSVPLLLSANRFFDFPLSGILPASPELQPLH